MPKFEVKNGCLYLEGKKVLKAWESFSGWCWFATKKIKDTETLNSDGRPVKDTIWFGFVHGFFDEWGTWSQAELEELKAKGKAWEIPTAWEIEDKNLPDSGRRR